MTATAPRIIAIDHDDYHAEYVGRLTDGRQFFLTSPFDPARAGHPGCEFVALYLFDSSGALLEAIIDSCGPREALDTDARVALRDQRLRDLGAVSFERISVAPFVVERFGLSFGLVLRTPEEEDEEWAVEVQPGNYMAFFEPWDSGDYDT